jgi:predicted  nucleic acid-binding Zn-ribbon protein
MTLLIMPIASSAAVKQTGKDEVTMTGGDLKALVSSYTRYKAEAEATKEALASERSMHDAYAASVNQLIEEQKAERTAFQTQLKKLERKLNAPAIEAYGGYNTDRQWEAGVRLVIKLH